MKSKTEKSTNSSIEKKNFFKKKKKPEKNLKLVVNLTKCSQNWSKIATELPKPIFKRQSLKQNSQQTKTDTLSKPKTEKDSKTIDNKEKIWFDVDKSLLSDEKNNHIETKIQTEQTVEIQPNKVRLTKALAIDCEMVGVGENGKDSILARVSIVNQFNECVYDKYVLPTEQVTDYRTNVSGIRPNDLKKSNNALTLAIVQKEISELLENKILVGHALHNDLKVLFLSHPKKKIRDTQKCKVFRQKHPSIGSLSSLKNLAKLLLGITIQEGEHNSVHDAQTAMSLYMRYKKEWEAYLRTKRIETKEAKTSSKETSSLIKDGTFTDPSTIQINSGNEKHKRYLQNKLKKRQKFTKKFFK